MKKIAILLLCIFQISHLRSVSQKVKPEGPIANLPNEMLYKIAQDKLLADISKAKSLKELDQVYKGSLLEFAGTNKLNKDIVSDVKKSNVVKEAYARVESEILNNIQDILCKKDIAYSKFDISKNGINALDQNKDTPLIIAASKNHEDIVKLLMKNEANINAQNKYGNTALMKAASNNSIDIAKFLIFNGANINVINEMGASALMIACFSNNIKLAELLIKNGANVNAQKKDGNTALMEVIAFFPNIELVKLLFKKGANINVKNKLGDTALTLGANFGSKDIVKFLVQNKAVIDSQNAKGDTALIIATCRGDKDIVNILLSNGANFDIKNKNGESAYDIATQNKILFPIFSQKKMKS